MPPPADRVPMKMISKWHASLWQEMVEIKFLSVAETMDHIDCCLRMTLLFYEGLCVTNAEVRATVMTIQFLLGLRMILLDPEVGEDCADTASVKVYSSSLPERRIYTGDNARYSRAFRIAHFLQHETWGNVSESMNLANRYVRWFRDQEVPACWAEAAADLRDCLLVMEAAFFDCSLLLRGCLDLKCDYGLTWLDEESESPTNMSDLASVDDRVDDAGTAEPTATPESQASTLILGQLPEMTRLLRLQFADLTGLDPEVTGSE